MRVAQHQNKHFILLVCTLLALLFSNLFGSGLRAQEAPPKAMLILDGSGSMWGKITDGHKFLLARRAIAKNIRPYDEKISLGLIAYGHRKRGACQDIQLLQSPSPLNALSMIRLVNSIKPLGKTPITSSIEEATKALGRKGGPIILLTDGPENCRRNPCELVTPQYAKQNNITIHVVAFSMQKEEANNLACLAKNSGGQLITPNTFNELDKALNVSLRAAFKGQRLTIPAQKLVTTKRAKPLLQLSAHLGPDSDALTRALNWRVVKLNKNQEPEQNLPPWVSTKAQTKFDLNSGNYQITATYKDYSVTKDITLKKGEARNEKLIFNLSELVLPASWATPDSRSGFGKLLLHTPSDGRKKATTTVIQLSERPERRLIKSGVYKISAIDSGEMRNWFIHASPGQTITLPLWTNVGRIKFKLATANKKTPLKNPLLRILKATSSKKGPIEVARSTAINPQFDLPKGNYLVKLTEGHATLIKPFTVVEAAEKNETLFLKQAKLRIAIKENTISNQPSLEIKSIPKDNPPKLVTKTIKFQDDITLSPGRYRLSLKFSPAALPVVKTLTLKNGDEKTLSFSPTTTKISFKISNRDDPVSRHQIFWQLFEKSGNILWQSGKPNPTIALNKGRYRIRAELGNETFETTFRINGVNPRTIDLAGKKMTRSTVK